MIRGLYTAASGMLLNNQQSDAIKQNMENINTPGYRQESERITSFPRLLVSRVTPPDLNSQSEENVLLGIMGTGVYAEKKIYRTEPGIMRETGNNTDLAINCPGYFVIDTLQGERYTRNGHFELDPSGILRTAGGNLVLGENGPIGPLSEHFEIKEDGTVVNIELETIENEDGTESVVENEIVMDRLRIVDIRAEDLQRDGLTTLFRAENPPVSVAAEDVRIAQGFLEEGNIDINAQMVKMLQVLRSYSANQKVVQTSDSLLQKAANEIGRA